MRGPIKMSRSYLIPRRRGGQFGGIIKFRRSSFEASPYRARASRHPVRSLKGGFAMSCLMSRPPLLCEEGIISISHACQNKYFNANCRILGSIAVRILPN